MKKIIILVCLMWSTCVYLVNAQFALNYNDVLVIVNNNSSLSLKIGEYFRQQRNIPNSNICKIACSTQEEIDSLQFIQIQRDIENYLQTNNLVSTINYLVTTKGLPLRIKRFSKTFSYKTGSASFEGELSMILSDLTTDIGKAGPVVNPYFMATSHFSRNRNFKNIFLVTRLDGYTYEDVKGLIDRAGQAYRPTGKFVFDRDPNEYPSLNDYMSFAKDILVKARLNVILDSSEYFLVNQENVLGYVSWGSNDHFWQNYTQRAQPHFTWSPKALAETYVSSSARTFSDSNYIDPEIGKWQSLIADLIHENGVTGCKGYVYEPYSTALTKAHILFDRWFKNFNLAESYYASSNLLGWMDVVVGDPKCLLRFNNASPKLLVLNSEPTFRISSYPNPFTIKTTIQYTLSQATNNVTFEIIDLLGRTVYFSNQNQTPGEYSITLTAEQLGLKANSSSILYRNSENPAACRAG